MLGVQRIHLGQHDIEIDFTVQLPPSASKDDASPFRPLLPPGGLMEQLNASLQRGCQG